METLIGSIAAILTTAAFLPQTLHIIRTRQTAGISMVMYCIFAAGVCLWMVYGVMIMSWPVIISNTLTLMFSLTIIALKWRFQIKRDNRDPA